MVRFFALHRQLYFIWADGERSESTTLESHHISLSGRMIESNSSSVTRKPEHSSYVAFTDTDGLIGNAPCGQQSIYNEPSQYRIWWKASHQPTIRRCRVWNRHEALTLGGPSRLIWPGNEARLYSIRLTIPRNSDLTPFHLLLCIFAFSILFTYTASQAGLGRVFDFKFVRLESSHRKVWDSKQIRRPSFTFMNNTNWKKSEILPWKWTVYETSTLPPRQHGILDVFAALVSSDEKIHHETAENVSRETIDKMIDSHDTLELEEDERKYGREMRLWSANYAKTVQGTHQEREVISEMAKEVFQWVTKQDVDILKVDGKVNWWRYRRTVPFELDKPSK